jgi:hypothetical protein
MTDTECLIAKIKYIRYSLGIMPSKTPNIEIRQEEKATLLARASSRTLLKKRLTERK